MGCNRFADRVRNWSARTGSPEHHDENVKRRLADFRAGVYMRTLLRDSAAGLMHSMIYFGFLALLGVTTVLEVDHQMPESAKFLHGKTYLAYSMFADLAGVVFMAGIVWAILRRYVQRPYRTASRPNGVAAIRNLFLIGASGFRERCIARSTNPATRSGALGYPRGTLFVA